AFRHPTRRTPARFRFPVSAAPASPPARLQPDSTAMATTARQRACRDFRRADALSHIAAWHRLESAQYVHRWRLTATPRAVRPGLVRSTPRRGSSADLE